jgi:hypothetical protein
MSQMGKRSLLSVKSVKSVVTFPWLGLAALRSLWSFVAISKAILRINFSFVLRGPARLITNARQLRHAVNTASAQSAAPLVEDTFEGEGLHFVNGLPEPASPGEEVEGGFSRRGAERAEKGRGECDATGCQTVTFQCVEKSNSSFLCALCASARGILQLAWTDVASANAEASVYAKASADKAAKSKSIEGGEIHVMFNPFRVAQHEGRYPG